MSRIRTIPRAVASIQEKDPESNLTVTVLRRWVKEGRIPHVREGKNFFIDLDALERYLEQLTGEDRG